MRARRSSIAGDPEAFARADPMLRLIAPRGAEEEFAVLFGVRAADLMAEWELGAISGWRLPRRLWTVAESCASALRPYARVVARGHAPGSLEALSRLPSVLLGSRHDQPLTLLRSRLKALGSEGLAVLAWPSLWEVWMEGGGGSDPIRMAWVFEALGFGLEPDPRLGRSGALVALFRLPGASPPGPSAPDRTALPVFALAASVLTAGGLHLPSLGTWIRLVAISGLSGEDAPRMEAHLAFRAATGRRPGPVRRALGGMPAERRRRLGTILVDVGCSGGPPGQDQLKALERAYGVLGLPRLALGRDLAARLGEARTPTGYLATSPRDAPPGGGGEKPTRAHGRGLVPAHVREAFEDWVFGGCAGDVLMVGGLGTPRPLASVLRSLRGCQDPLPPEVSERLGLSGGASYDQAAVLLSGPNTVRHRQGSGDTHPSPEAPTPFGPENDQYDARDPLLNLGWPVLIRGLLYRVDDEILKGMEGQPDLPWEDFHPSEALPAPDEVLAAERSRPAGRSGP